MSQKLYLDDSYKTSFDAVIKSVSEAEKEFLVELEGTFFYPESGGQPADHGTIGSSRVLDVQMLGERVIHILDAEPIGNNLPAKIDRDRRYDHMQQHTGQHLLTHSLIQLYDAKTVGFHLGEHLSTIDITMQNIEEKQISEVEDLCSQWISADLPVTVKYVTKEEFLNMDLRKKALPDHIAGPVRLISIGDIDTAHCGGTHLKSLAELQFVKIIASEKVRDTLRIHFLAGKRATSDYREKHTLLAQLSDNLTTGINDLIPVIAKLQKENKEKGSKLKKLEIELASLRAEADLADVIQIGSYNVLCKRYDELDQAGLKSIATQMTGAGRELIFCGAGSQTGKAALVLAADDSFTGDLGQIIRELLPVFEGKGGGRGRFAQAVGNAEKIDETLEAAKEIIKTLEKKE